MAAIRKIAGYIDDWQWVLLVVVAPFLMFPSQSRLAFLLVIPGLWLISLLAGRRPFVQTPINLALLLLGVMVVVSLFATYDFFVSLPKVAGTILGLGIFFSLARLGQNPYFWWIGLVAFVGVGSGVATISLLGTNWIPKIFFLTPITARLPNLFGSIAGVGDGFQPNQVAGALLWVLAPCVVLAAICYRQRRKLDLFINPKYQLLLSALTITAAVLIAGVFILTQSRGGYLGFGFGLLAVIVISLPAQRRQRLLAWFVLLLLAGSVGAWLYQVNTQTNFAERFFGSGDPALSLDTLTGRFELWSRALYAIHDFPFTGMGMNTFRYIVHIFYPLFLTAPDFDIGHAHNEFLQAALDLGIPGLIAFLAIHGSAFCALGRIWHTRDLIVNKLPANEFIDNIFYFTIANLPPLVVALASGLLMHMIYGITDAVALGAKPGILFWMLLGLIVSLLYQVEDHISKHEALSATKN